ncbi:MAG: L,D-transpeptidase, partial [Acidimicrobiia bacterium]|nr:L,D-transpeptidase [Acidimicrobiia bacterium]
YSFYFGNPGDVPVSGDFDGDGCDTVSIYRPLEATFYVINQLGSGNVGLGAAEFSFPFGNVGDQPLAGDFDGDGVDTMGVFQPSSGFVHLTSSHSSASDVATLFFGQSSDLMLAGSWDGGADQLGLYRSSLRGFLLANGSQRTYGNESLYPIAGQFGALPGGGAPPPTQPSYPNVGWGKRIIYSNSDQRVWLIEEDGTLTSTYLVSGRANTPSPGTYSIFSKSLQANAGHDGITMAHMARFAHGTRLPYGFHAIPLYSDGRPMQTIDELGYYRSGGCVRQTNEDAAFLYEWAPIGTAVHVLP